MKCGKTSNWIRQFWPWHRPVAVRKCTIGHHMSCFFYLKNILGTKIRYEVLFLVEIIWLHKGGIVHITAVLIPADFHSNWYNSFLWELLIGRSSNTDITLSGISRDKASPIDIYLRTRSAFGCIWSIDLETYLSQKNSKLFHKKSPSNQKITSTNPTGWSDSFLLIVL